MKLFRQLLLLTPFFLSITNTLDAQCPNDNNIFHEIDLTPSGQGDTKTHFCMWGGDHARFTVAIGNEYLIESCNGPFNSHLTIYDEDTGTLRGFSNIDNCTTDDESWSWTAPIDGNVFILVDDNNCVHEPGCNRITVTLLSVFPVDLVDFSAHASDNKTVVLNWETATEKNNDFFEILRSTDDLSFQSIGQVKGNGTTNESQFYKYEDSNIEPNILYYYKLKQVDVDGKSEDSPIETAIFKDYTITSRLSPNPAKDITYLNFNATSATVHLKITNVNGQVLDTQVHEPNNFRFDRIPIDLKNIESAGFYILSVEIGEDRFTEKLFVTK